MKHKRISKVVLSYVIGTTVLSSTVPLTVHAAPATSPVSAATPIEHVIVIIGENHTFDNLFATYQAKHGQRVSNLLSKGIIKPDGTPGPMFGKSAQQQADNRQVYKIDPTHTGAYATLPQPQTTYATGLPPGVPDTRFPANLPNGPFQITRYVSYDAHTGDPQHRFFQMWQQYDEGRLDLFPWVATTIGTGGQNAAPAPTPANTFQGGESMGFYNMQSGDAPIFRYLADHYAISDNYHQPIMGGTGANFLALVTGDLAYHNQNGQPDTPPANQIENPDPQGGTNNFYQQDGYAGGSYVNCADQNQPGVPAISRYLSSLPYQTHNNGNCAANTYYLVNNYGLGYKADGTPQPLGPTHFTLPPQHIPTIADALSTKGVSWKWYSGGRNADGTTSSEYCGICDPLTGFTSIMTSSLKNNLVGMDALDHDMADEKSMPAVAFVRPPESQAGHPANATVPDYEKFVASLIAKVKNNPELWKKTAILVTTDEGGGYYDSGYIQPVDFFGDGTRIPLMVVSPYARKGYVDHTYYDHVSILKFIEANWGLQPLSARSRDNLPNPIIDTRNDPYVPMNRPAIGDLMNMFDFQHHRNDRDQDDMRSNVR
ncbi:alkaline phosphatase family protein [Noviherbaspirillum pedocola]|uniref:alkaline phosphatase family protein n=1 Tax=Noviherbaspirillum pedocola TaxID=2801341 RepID=UPI001F483EAF|nr:alkaline phosphatase family protein [Noviherbaspirillum pedocola]